MSDSTRTLFIPWLSGISEVDIEEYVGWLVKFDGQSFRVVDAAPLHELGRVGRIVLHLAPEEER